MPKLHEGQTAVIVGAGPAGLTAAYELLEKTGVKPIILEASDMMGGIAKTVNYKGNRIDIGGHRFFSKSDRVMEWWQKIMPLQGAAYGDVRIAYHGKTREVQTGEGPDPKTTDRVMLVRNRLSRIFYLRKFFAYPVSLNMETIRNLGIVRMARIGFSYIKAMLFPIKPEKSLEDFFINRFGRELYLTFFKDYTEKVWGVPCTQIPPEWGAQRIKGLSITKTVLHMMKQMLPKTGGVSQKGTETSLIERFLYPKLGPGQMWDEVARLVRERSGEILTRREVIGMRMEHGRVVSVRAKNAATGAEETHPADYVFSTMPIRELVAGMTPAAPANVREVAEGLMYRDFVTVGLLLKKLSNGPVPDNWIYVQERDVKVGRLQIFNNWSPYLVKEPGTVWIGMEYFCNEGDNIWEMEDGKLKSFAASELAKIGLCDAADVIDGTVIRQPKAYPAYFGTYDRLGEIRAWLDAIPNLFCVGRNGMHRYNNQDHSMLTAMLAVENIADDVTDKSNLWAVNTEEEYHEAKKA